MFNIAVSPNTKYMGKKNDNIVNETAVPKKIKLLLTVEWQLQYAIRV